jgi:signal transduction histidine kinase
LATVLSSINLVSRHSENGNQEAVQKHVARIKNSVRNLTSILNDFLSLEKLEAGKVHFRPEEFDICELANEVVEDISSMTKKDQMVELSCDGDFHLTEERMVDGLDPQLIRNILFNLLSNAVKYSGEGKKIMLSVEINDNLIIKVVDQGIGIPESEQQHLFERFFRAKNATNIQGTGLGLNIVQKHVELMNGTIDFTSQQDEGTTFVLSLPMQNS